MPRASTADTPTQPVSVPDKAGPSQRDFYLHVALRDFSFGVAKLGWINLAICGLPLSRILIALTAFRFVEAYLVMPLARRLLLRVGLRPVIAASLALQATLPLLFQLAQSSTVGLVALVLALALADPVYWPQRMNLERLTAPAAALGRGVAGSRAIGAVAETLGLVLAGYGLSRFDTATAFLAAAAILLSYLPLHSCLDGRGIPSVQRGFWQAMGRGAGPTTFLRDRFVVLLVLVAFLEELIGLNLVLLLTRFDLPLVDLGLLYAVFTAGAFLATLAAGYAFDRGWRPVGRLLGVGMLMLLGIFATLPGEALPVFFVLFGFVGAPWLAFIGAAAQREAQVRYGPLDAGFFLEFIDDSAKGLTYPYVFLLVVYAPSVFTAPVVLVAAAGLATAASRLVSMRRPEAESPDSTRA
ncbi:MAG: MFS transporter [Thermoanaerobaculia bacterium]